MTIDGESSSRDRRAIFRLGVRKLLNPLADYIENRLNIPLPVFRTCIRPPGAVPEKQFLDTCYRCGNCVDVCPVHAIRPLANGDVERAGTPYIDPDLGACVVCEDLACMRACPSGALKLVGSRNAIRMGMARVEQSLCVRGHGEDCMICIEKCPLGAEAIALDGRGEIMVKTTGCIGCGLCQFHCPTTPRAITVEAI